MAPAVVAQNLEPGIHASVNAATFTGESTADFSLRGSLGAGLSLGIPVTNSLLFQPEIRYVIKGANGKNARIEGVADGLEIESTISYLEIPLLLVFRIDRDGGVRPRVFGGVYAARNLDATIEWRLPTGGPTQSESDESVVENDYGLVLGGGVDIDVAGEAVVVGGRVSLGLTDIRDRPDAPLRNRAFEIFVGLLMR
jgi:hypothetical protein